ncbi:hypothetical protein GHK48_07670 [Sinorhizobium fredii]|uniref:Uncharacterized protein n=1 Tax=Rhizobium fredii TaxID=380 RepID=A0A844A5C8_RHIFR|nr:hypothetical protein [Sinorhizobium fredii]MQX08193.1 hypothetical protein [Sinorhizobium fredii]
MPNVLWNIANIERVVDDVKQRLRARQVQSVVTVPKIEAQIEARRQQQKAVLKQITERMVDALRMFHMRSVRRYGGPAFHQILHPRRLCGGG